MYLARVIGTVVSTSKNAALIGMKLLIVERVNEYLEREGKCEVAVDSVGAVRANLCWFLRAAPRGVCSAKTLPWIRPSSVSSTL